MNIDLAALPKDVDTLHRMIADLVGERDRERAEAEAEIDRLRGILKTLQRMQFGRRSERLDPDQLQLGLEDVAADLAEAEKAVAGKVDEPGKPTERSGQRLSVPDHLPREDRSVEAGVDICPCCGGVLHLIGEGVSEVLDHVPAQFREIRIRRPKFGCRSCGTIPRPRRPSGRSQRVWRRRRCCLTCSSASTATTFRSTGRARSSPAGVSL